MKNNDECYIVKDLLPNYTENLLNEKTTGFVNKHLKKCDNCNKYFELLKSNINEEISKEKVEDEIEFNYLRKVNRRIANLRIIAFVAIFTIILVILAILLKYKYNDNIIDRCYDNFERFKMSNNYKIIVDDTYIDYKTEEIRKHNETYFYKDGKYKYETGNITKYFEDNNNKSTNIFHNLKSIEQVTLKYPETVQGKLLYTMFAEINSYKSSNVIFDMYIKLGLNIRTEYFNGIECYVIRFAGNGDGYRDTWISKNEFIPVRIIDTVYDDYYHEINFTLIFNEIKEEDIDSSMVYNLYKDYDVKNVIIEDDEVSRLYYQMVSEND